jgi:hypothetical protein
MMRIISREEITKEEKRIQEPFSRPRSRARIFIKERLKKILSQQTLFIPKRKSDQFDS